MANSHCSETKTCICTHYSNVIHLHAWCFAVWRTTVSRHISFVHDALLYFGNSGRNYGKRQWQVWVRKIHTINDYLVLFSHYRDLTVWENLRSSCSKSKYYSVWMPKTLITRFTKKIGKIKSSLFEWLKKRSKRQ